MLDDEVDEDHEDDAATVPMFAESKNYYLVRSRTVSYAVKLPHKNERN